MAGEFSRGRRISDFVQRELATLIQRELRDPRLGMVTVSGVKVSSDLSWADVYVTVLGQDDMELSLDILTGAAGFLRSELSLMLTTRSTPRLRFHYDDTARSGAHMDQLIDEARARDKRELDSNTTKDAGE